MSTNRRFVHFDSVEAQGVLERLSDRFNLVDTHVIHTDDLRNSIARVLNIKDKESVSTVRAPLSHQFRSENSTAIKKVKNSLAATGFQVSSDVITHAMWILSSQSLQQQKQLKEEHGNTERWRFPRSTWLHDAHEFIRTLVLVSDSSSSKDNAADSMDTSWILGSTELKQVLLKLDESQIESPINTPTTPSHMDLQTNFRQLLKTKGLKRVDDYRFPSQNEFKLLLRKLSEIKDVVASETPNATSLFKSDDEGQTLLNDFGLPEFDQSVLHSQLSEAANCSRAVAQFFLRTVARGCWHERFDLDLMFASLNEDSASREEQLTTYFFSGIRLLLEGGEEKVVESSISDLLNRAVLIYKDSAEDTPGVATQIRQHDDYQQDSEIFIKREVQLRRALINRYLERAESVFGGDNEALMEFRRILSDTSDEELERKLKPEIDELFAEHLFQPVEAEHNS